jgi:hypothetical protein
MVLGSKEHFSGPMSVLGKFKKVELKHINPKRTLIGRRTTLIEFIRPGTPTIFPYRGQMGSLYGLSDGSVYIQGKFGSLPKAALNLGMIVVAVEYRDDAKARREGVEPAGKDWRHDFKDANVQARKCQGGLLLKGNKPLWEMR